MFHVSNMHVSNIFKMQVDVLSKCFDWFQVGLYLDF